MSTVSITRPDSSVQKVILLFGPTATGKTELLLRLFAGSAEVISADSLQAYRRLDIGTAKPDRKLREALPHHLIDIRDPDTQYNAGDFVKAADGLIAQISGRNNLPVISGGTPFYLRNFIYGLPETPPGDPAVREEVAREVDEKGAAWAYARLLETDPQAAARISPKDSYRIKRALEVYRTTGKNLSSFSVSYTRRKDFDMLLIGIDRPQEELTVRIAERVRAMFELGLVSEVASLIRAGYGEESPGMQGIGYREFLDMRKSGCLTLSEVREMIARDTRRYAKRQRTFFRRFPSTSWFHPDDLTAISETVKRFLD